MLAPAEKLQTIRNALPEEGLFADKDWLISPQAFPISEKLARELEQLGHGGIGGDDGMLGVFQEVLPNCGDILISEESATYRPEMEWLAGRMNLTRTSNIEQPIANWHVLSAENYQPQPGRDVYRFFE